MSWCVPAMQNHLVQHSSLYYGVNINVLETVHYTGLTQLSHLKSKYIINTICIFKTSGDNLWAGEANNKMSTKKIQCTL